MSNLGEREQWELTWIQLGGLGDLGKGMHTELIISKVALSMSSGSLIFFLMYMYVLKKIGEPGDEANNKKVGIVSIGKPCHLLCFVAEFLCQPS